MLHRFRVFPAVLLISAATAALAADVPATRSSVYQVRPRFAAGEAWRFVVVKTQSNSGGTKPAMTTRLRYTVDLRVVEATAKEAVLQWNLSKLEFLEPVGMKASDVAALTGMSDGVTLRYGVNSEGSLTEVKNFDEFMANSVKTFERMWANLPEAEQQKRRDDFARMLKDEKHRALLAQTMLSEPSMLHQFAGIAFSSAAPKQLCTFPNPFGGSPLPGTTRCILVSSTAAQADVRIESVINPEAGDIVVKTIQKADADSGRQTKFPDKIQLDMTTTVEGTFKAGRSFPSTVKYRRAVDLNGSKNETTYEFSEVAVDSAASRPAK